MNEDYGQPKPHNRQSKKKERTEQQRLKAREYRRRSYLKNRDAQTLKMREYYAKNAEMLLAGAKIYREKNADKIAAQRREAYLKNAEAIKGKSIAYYHKNKESCQKKNRERKSKNRQKYNQYVARQKKQNPAFAITYVLRSRMLSAIKRADGEKSEKTVDLLGCSPRFFVKYIESLFSRGMNWGNRGKGWHIDHILPCTSFDLTNTDEQRKCFHFSNLRPVWAKENLKKGASIITCQPELPLIVN